MIDVDRPARGAAAIFQLATRLERAALHTAAPFGKSAPLHKHVASPQAPLGHAPIQARAAIRAHAALYAMPKLRPIIHLINLPRCADSCQTNTPAKLPARAHP